jgi:small GTP-binding protein
VGKSNVIRRILGKDFQELEATIGVEFGCLEVKNIDANYPDITVSIQVWDTCKGYVNIAGAERYRAITTSHIRNADGAYLIYDITNEASFNGLEFWYDCIRKATDEDIVIYLVGNKLDLVSQGGVNRQVPFQKGIDFARKYNLAGFCECSAKDNLNIQDTFTHFYKGKFISLHRYVH